MKYEVLAENLRTDPMWAVLRLNHHYANATLFVLSMEPTRHVDGEISWRVEYVAPKSLTHLPYTVLDTHMRRHIDHYLSDAVPRIVES